MSNSKPKQRPTSFKKIFGTDGVRGKANIEPVTSETALQLGRAAAHVFKNVSKQTPMRGRHQIVIGKDTRLSGYMLENAMSAGVLSMGVDVLFIGPLPTPGVAYATRSLRADAGIVLTASHNPYDDNGIKFFRADGYKLDDGIESQIEELVFSGSIDNIRPTAEEIGKAVRIEDALGRYIEHAKSSFPRGCTLEGFRIVVDAGHGAAYKSTPCVLRELGAEVILFGDKPDGTNINQDCGSMHPEYLAEKVRQYRADIGIAHDGDADRVIMCDGNGKILDGDDIMVICALDMLQKKTLAHNTLVATVMSNAGLEPVIEKAGGRVIRTSVGDRYVIDEMIKSGYNFGGEQSGHIIFKDYSTTGDGLVAALQVLQVMQSSQTSLAKLSKCWQRFPQKLSQILVSEKRPFEKMDEVTALVKEAETALKARGGRVLLRYSGTEPKARLLVEGSNMAELEMWTVKISEAIRKQVGA